MKIECLIIGAGLSGLSTAYHLERPYLVCEKENTVGGLCRTIYNNGYYFDLTGHLLHLRDDYFKNLIKRLIGDELAIVQRNAWIYSQNVFTRYPFQSNTYGLPHETVKACLMGFIDTMIQQKVADALNTHIEIKTFEDWILQTLGKGIAEHFMIPYNSKLWTVHPAEMSCDWMNRFIPRPALEEVIEGALADKPSQLGYNANFLYPRAKGIQILPQSLANKIDNIRLNTELVKIDLIERKATFTDNMVIEFDNLVTTVPLPELLDMIQPLPPEIEQMKGKLRWASVYNLNFGLRSAPKSDKHWIYIPETRYICYRLGYITNFSKMMAPNGCQSVYTEISYSKNKPLEKNSVVSQMIMVLKKIGIITDEKQIDHVETIDIPYGYVIYDFAYNDVVPKIHNYLNSQKIYSIGRYGKWVYGSMEDALIEGRQIADMLNTQFK